MSASAYTLDNSIDQNTTAVARRNLELLQRLLETTHVLLRENLFPNLSKKFCKIFRRKL